MRTMWIGASIAAVAAIGSGHVSYSEEINLGKNEYLNSCASCHGVTGKGHGPVIKSLIKAPPDLTKLPESS
jgi:mono/diheme cytochrome c family protein